MDGGDELDRLIEVIRALMAEIDKLKRELDESTRQAMQGQAQAPEQGEG